MKGTDFVALAYRIAALKPLGNHFTTGESFSKNKSRSIVSSWPLVAQLAAGCTKPPAMLFVALVEKTAGVIIEENQSIRACVHLGGRSRLHRSRLLRLWYDLRALVELSNVVLDERNLKFHLLSMKF